MIEILGANGTLLAWDGRVVEGFGFGSPAVDSVRFHALEIVSMQLRDARIVGPVMEFQLANGTTYTTQVKFDEAAQAAFAEIAAEVAAVRAI